MANALLTSENLDCAVADSKWRRTVAARCSKQVGEISGYSALVWPSLRHTIGRGVTGCVFSFTLCMPFAHALPFDWCTGESRKSDSCTKSLYK